MPESTIRVLRDDCSCTENLVGSWVRNFALERGASFFCRRDVFEKENNPCVSSLSQKFFFFRASFLRRRQNLLLYHMYHFWSRWWEQSQPEPYLFLSTSIFAGQNDQLRLKSSKTVLKAFQLIFPWLKMKWKTLCISNLDSWVDQKKHLNKDAQKKMFMK